MLADRQRLDRDARGTRSGLAEKSIQVGPCELNFAIVSLLRVLVASSLDAPTVNTHGAFPGE